ncbi:MAG: hypothetical protein MZU97_25035 [Bacillus subtilis]|nr:hypothetical protein [Bacillus subtilis]
MSCFNSSPCSGKNWSSSHILGFLYWCYDKKVGEQVGITVFISLVINSSIKTLVQAVASVSSR